MRGIFIVGFSLCVCWGYTQSHYPGQHTGTFKLTDYPASAVLAFDLQDVTLLPSRFTENMQREEKWILSIPVKSLLHSFRTNAGVYSGNEGGYSPTKGTPKLVGWESLDCELRGHTTWHNIYGKSLVYATNRKPEFKLKDDILVSAISLLQSELNQNVYLSSYGQ